MTDDATSEDRARGAGGGASAGYWVFIAFCVLAVVMSAFPGVRAVAVYIITLPLRLIGWAVPGEGLYADASAVSTALGWLGWIALGVIWIPLLLALLAIALQIVPASARAGSAWGKAVSGGYGPFAQGGALAAAALPLIATIMLIAMGRLLAWPLSLAATLSFALASPLVFRREHSIVALTRLSAQMIDYAATLLGAATRWAALALVLVVATIVTQRYVFGIAFTKLAEIVVYLHAAMFMLMAAATLKSDGHVRVDVFYGSMPPRGKALVNLIGVYVLLIPMCLVILSTSSRYVDLAWRVMEGSPETDGLPLVFVLKTLIPAFAVILMAQGGALAARSILTLVGEDDGEAPAGDAHPPAA